MFIPSENKVHYYYYKERETSKKAVNQGAVILQIIFGIYTRCQQMKVKVRSSKFERQKMYIHFETEPGIRIRHSNQALQLPLLNFQRLIIWRHLFGCPE